MQKKTVCSTITIPLRGQQRRQNATNKAQPPHLALPAVFGNGGHDGPNTGGVVQLVALLARYAPRLPLLGTRVVAHLAHAALLAGPARTYT